MAKDNTKKHRQAKKKASNKASAKVSNSNQQAAVAAVNEETPKQRALKPVSSRVPKVIASIPAALRKWNGWLSLVYALEGLAIVLLSKNVTVPLTVQYPSVDTLASEASGHQVISGAAHHLTDINLGWAVAVFLIIFAATRFVMGGLLRNPSEPNTSRGIASLRWVGFGMGGAVMVATIALLSGINQAYSLALLMLSVFVGCLLMLGTEVLVDNNQGIKTRFSKFMYNLAAACMAAPWVVFAITIIGALAWHGHISGYMYSVYGCTALLFFAILLAAKFRLNRQGRWADGLYTERGYTILEFLLASLLAWQIFVGALR